MNRNLFWRADIFGLNFVQAHHSVPLSNHASASDEIDLFYCTGAPWNISIYSTGKWTRALRNFWLVSYGLATKMSRYSIVITTLAPQLNVCPVQKTPKLTKRPLQLLA
jgi:hypothetical protein